MANDLRFTPAAIALGSWNTWSRLSFETARDIIAEALESGVSLFEVAYYWDKPHTEVLFGHVLRTLGVARSDYQLAQKLWLWDYPEVGLTDQLDSALTRLGLSEADTIMVPRPANVGLDMHEYLADVNALIESGRAREWGMTNWDAPAVEDALAVAHKHALRAPMTVQLQYNLARRNVVEGPEFQHLFDECGVSLQPSFVLEGGILAGKLERDRMQPEVEQATASTGVRNIARDAGGIRPAIREGLPRLREIAAGFGVTTAQIAVAFALLHPHRSTVLLGVSSAEQLREALAAVDLAAQHGPEVLAALENFNVGDTFHPELFNPRAGRRLG